MFNYLSELRPYFYYNNVTQEDLEKIYRFIDSEIEKSQEKSKQYIDDYIEELNSEIAGLKDEADELEWKLEDADADDKEIARLERKLENIRDEIEELELERDDLSYRTGEIEDEIFEWCYQFIDELELLCKEFNLEFNYEKIIKERALKAINNPNQMKFNFEKGEILG